MITPLTVEPNSVTNPSGFNDEMDTHLAELNPMISQMNALAVSMDAVAAGGTAIPYTFSTTTTDADPGAGILRLGSATQNAATVIRSDLVGSDGTTFTDLIDSFDDSTSTVKGQIILMNAADATKWLVFNLSSIASPSGYKNITVENVASSAASPFSDGDSLLFKFTRTGDKGDTGPSGLSAWVHLSTVTASSSATVNIESTFDSTYDAYVLVGSGITFAAAGAGLECQMKVGGAYASSGYTSHSYLMSSGSAAYNGYITTTTDFLIVNDTGTASTDTASFQLFLTQPSSTAFSKGSYWTAYMGKGTVTQCGGGWGTQSAITALTGLRFLMSDASNINGGKFRLYGISNS